jgi:hypothetical protein
VVRYLPRKSVVYLLFLVLLIGVGFIGWFVIKYPAQTGGTWYDTDIPPGFDVADAELALTSAGYSVERYHDSIFRNDQYLWIVDSSDKNGVTEVSIFVEEWHDSIQVSASRQIYIPPYGVFTDRQELSREQREIAIEDAREILDIVGIPSTGTFTDYGADSLDYFVPFSVLYLLVFGHFPLMVIFAVSIVNESERKNDPILGQGFSSNQTQY